MSVNHLTSSPHYPQSNGLAEKFVGIIKNLFHRAKEEGQSPYTALMVYRSTPINGTLQSPMQFHKVDKLILTYHCHMLPKCKWASTMHPNQLLKVFTFRISCYPHPHMISPLVKMSCTGNPMTKDGIPQLSSNSYRRRDHTSSKQMTMLFIEKHKYI